jgi:molecular chaperone DnaK
MMGTRAVGVDFGTSTSLVAERDGAERAEILPLGDDLRTRYVPSVAALRGGRIVLAEQAEGRRSDAVIRSIKRGITENRDQIRVATTDGELEVSVDEVVLGLLNEIAARTRTQGLHLDQERLVRLGCPAMWTGPQRRRLIDLARKAGLPVDHATLVDEPVAAGVAWLAHRYLAHRDAPQGRVLVFDMGGGTLDLAVLDVIGGAKPDVTVLAAIGIAEAGDDLDRTLVREFEADLSSRGLDLDSRPDAAELRGELLTLARDTKVALSANSRRTVVLDAERFGGVQTLDFSRLQLEEAFEPQVTRAEQMVWAALRSAKLTEEFAPQEFVSGAAESKAMTPDELRRLGPDQLRDDVKHVVLAGGMSRIPLVATRLSEMFPKAELHERVGDFLADEVVVAGLADTAGYDKISLHRPAFDFVLEWDGGRERRMLYEAYTPLYDPAQVARGNAFLGHGWHGRYPDVAREGEGVLRVLSPTGDLVRLEIDDQLMDGIRIGFGSHAFSFKIYCGGQILIADGSGRRLSMNVANWPVLRGGDVTVKLMLTRIVEESDPVVPWYYDDIETDDRPYG